MDYTKLQGAATSSGPFIFYFMLFYTAFIRFLFLAHSLYFIPA